MNFILRNVGLIFVTAFGACLAPLIAMLAEKSFLWAAVSFVGAVFIGMAIMPLLVEFEAAQKEGERK